MSDWFPFPWIRFDPRYLSELQTAVEEAIRNYDGTVYACVETSLWRISRVFSPSEKKHQFWVTTKTFPLPGRYHDFKWTMGYCVLDDGRVKEQGQHWNYAKILKGPRAIRWYDNMIPENCPPIHVYPGHVVIDDVLWFLMREAGYV